MPGPGKFCMSRVEFLILRPGLVNSVATVMTDVFHKNEINLLRKFGKIVRIFDKIDDSKKLRSYLKALVIWGC